MARKKTKEEEYVSLMMLLEVTGNALNAFAGLVGRQTVAGQILAIASATINTSKAANQALSTYPPPLSFVAMAGTIAAGIENVRNIMKVQIPRKWWRRWCCSCTQHFRSITNNASHQ